MHDLHAVVFAYEGESANCYAHERRCKVGTLVFTPQYLRLDQHL